MPSQTAEYALRAVVYIASLEGDAPVPVGRVAEALGVPANYLSKTLNALVNVGLLRSTPGRRGGFQLGRRAAAIPLAAVLDVFDGTPGSPVCLLKEGSCEDGEPCRAHDAWDRVWRARRAPIVRTTVADLLTGGRELA